MPHRIQSLPVKGGDESFCHPASGLSFTSSGDALRPLLRLMVAAGLSGPAETFRGETRCLIVKDIVAASKFTLTETDRRGFRLRAYVPYSAKPSECPVQCPGHALEAV